MRILHIVGTISPAAGGPTEVIQMLTRYAPEGYESELVTLDCPTAPFLQSLPYPVYALGEARKSWYAPQLLPWLRENAERFDGVIVHGLWEYTGLAVRLALHGRVPYVVFPHGMLDPYFKQQYPLKHLKKWLYWLLAEYWVLRGAMRVLFTTELERDLALQTFSLARWRPMVAPLGSEAPPAPAAELIEALRARSPELFVQHDGAWKPLRFLLFLGRLHPKKGCELLIEAFATIAQQDPTLHLVMAGPDGAQWQHKLEELAATAGIADRVLWPGILLGEAKWGAFAACEVFALPSHQENFGVAVVEALASGRPVLISNQVNISPEIATDGCGYVEADTLEGTRRLLERWLATAPDDRARMAAQARSTFDARYDMRRNTAAILRVFEDAARERASANAVGVDD
jgi:glycosyltransferase involved in cell wall biosynthesis